MTDSLLIKPIQRPFNADIHLPGSKSVTNRALLMAALAKGRSRLEDALFSDDTRFMSAALITLGLGVEENESDNWFEVEGGGGRIPVTSAELFIGNSGTAARFLTAAVSLGKGVYRIDGNERMRERPIADLIDALSSLGVNIRSIYQNGCPPMEVFSDGLPGGKCSVGGSVSSQFLTALLLIAPYAVNGITIDVVGDLVSKPYVDMTLKMMSRWGVKVRNYDFRRFSIGGGQSYQPLNYAIEPDASAASYFYAAAAITGSTITTPGLGSDSIQGDTKFVNVLVGMGCSAIVKSGSISLTGPKRLRGIDVDMNGISDTVMTLAAIAPFAETPTAIRNVAHIRRKETDRISAIAAELDKLGVRVTEADDGLTIYPAPALKAVTIETYDDHRMAMSFAITGLRSPGIRIQNPECVAKTFPDFFKCLNRLYGARQ
jgi:3-phosphoshikimate 1-carboxyvinyltransferase